MSKTFGNILDENKGAGPGFDILRLFLAIAVLMSHVAPIGKTRGFFPELFNLIHGSGGTTHSASFVAGPIAKAIADDRWHPLHSFALTHVPMFFALSGFLVAGSAFRTKRLVPFLALRFFRIFPALCVEVTLSAIIIGVIFTILPTNIYYSSHQFLSYFGNIIGIVQMELPGVSFNGSEVVNANLWTLPSEFHCYLLLGAMIVSGLLFVRRAMNLIFVISTAGFLLANWIYNYQASPNGILDGWVNVYYFFCGAMLYLWRDKIPYSWWLLVPFIAITYVLMSFQHAIFIYPLMLTYITVFIGLTSFPTNWLVSSGDYSYGIYLYGFPITQVLVAVIPGMRHNYFVLLLSSILCTGLFAAFSWHVIEKKFLRLRKHFSVRSAKIAQELRPSILR